MMDMKYINWYAALPNQQRVDYYNAWLHKLPSKSVTLPIAEWAYNEYHMPSLTPRDPNEPDKLSEEFKKDPQRVSLIINEYTEMIYGKPYSNGSQKSQS